ncbi:MAG: lipoprotein [Granulosicoccus sp.]
MTLKLRTMALPLGLVLAVLLTACGNKGDLYLVPDEVTEQDLIRLEQALQNNAALSPESDEDDSDDSKKDKKDSDSVAQ